ncbi:hypothetical protein G7Y89_g1611 [Cudoniella acicularis]|uniref:Uncharacterized protein n=1 Tax=Cudoniella acicularis TaxID=354080 RepID=A0A8H4RW10_9HELO|nr:hypothetical protein G7Y89_g1611 [Cudoniella acicularis]
MPKLHELLCTFDTNPDSGPRKRKRSAFSLDGRKKVRKVRESGACVSCRLRKISCSENGICGHCNKAANNPQLAKQICLRNKLKDTYVGVKEIFGKLDERRAVLDPILQSLTGSSVPILLSVGPFGAGRAALPLNVMRCNASPVCRWKGLGKINGIFLTCDSVYDERYVVDPSTLPSVDEIDRFGRNILSISRGSHSGEITRLLDDFLLSYCSLGSSSPLRQFSDSTLKIAGLNNIVCYGYLHLRDGSFDLLNRPSTENAFDTSYISPTVHEQIRLLAAEGLERVEESVFSEIDAFNKLIGANKHARIVGGICLLRLLLLYRDRVFRDRIRLHLPTQKLRHRTRLEQWTFMYKRLSIAYGALCRDSNSPITTKWVAEEGPENHELKLQFQRLRSPYLDLCNEKLTQDHDDVFKSLVTRGKETTPKKP